MTTQNSSTTNNLQRTISNVTNSGQMNLGDHVVQSQQISSLSPEVVNLFQNLLSEINKISDADDKQDALDDANKLKQAVEEKKPDRARKLIGKLPDFIRTTASALSIAKFIETLGENPPPV